MPMHIDTRVNRLDWAAIGQQLDAEGHALLPGLLAADAVQAWRALAQQLAAAHDAPLWRAPDAPPGAWAGPPGSWPDGSSDSSPVSSASSWANSWAADRWVAHHLTLQHAGEAAFRLRIVALLSEPGVDFDGGEFVMTEQRPRMQSRPMVLPLQLGDVAVIAGAQRPVQGSQGHYRAMLRHGISRVHRGERIGLALSLDGAP